MSVRVGKYNYKTKQEPKTPGYTNVLIHTTGDLSPYTMKDKDGVIMENYWQFNKIWETVDAIKQPLSQYMPDRIRWEHPKETHMKNGKPTREYWKWRKKGFSHYRWVRYPNGFKNHSQAKGSVYGNPNNYEILGYIEARKKIYFQKYREIAIKTPQFKELKSILNKGGKIQINEVDGPRYESEYPYNLTKNGSMDMTEKTLRALINTPNQAFGHGYALAACLLDIDLTVDSNDKMIIQQNNNYGTMINSSQSLGMDNILTIWTDGACTNNGYANAKAGYGVYFEGLDWDISKRLKGKPTNNRAELYAVYAALKRVYFRDKSKKTLHFRIDNKIALDTLLSDRKSGANWDIIEKLYKVKDLLKKRGYVITGEWVKGHSKVAGNERADELASYGAQKKARKN